MLCALVLSSCGGGGRHSIELNSEADLAGLQVGVVSGSR